MTSSIPIVGYTYAMSEDLNRFRTREETSNRSVWVYRFAERATEISDNPERGDYLRKMLEFSDIHEEMQVYKERRETPPQKLVERRRELQKELDPYLERQYRKRPKSILKGSTKVSRKPHESGKDSYVYFYGSEEEFHATPDTPRYVQKYSVPTKEVGPDNVEYLQKKYQILKKILGDHIPRAWFVLGEFRHGIPKHELGEFHTSIRAVTIQREVRGKTFQEMTDKERRRPKVQEALKEAMSRYLEARAYMRQMCKDTGVDPRTFELSLDVGELSPDTREAPFDPLYYMSPNAMYDERKNKVYFIDMGWGTWNSDKERVFKYILEHSEVH